MALRDNEEEIGQLKELLRNHRRTLEHYVHQRVQHGSAFEPPVVSHGIAEARQEIKRIKQRLRDLDEAVEDHSNDEEEKGYTKDIKLSNHQADTFIRETKETRIFSILGIKLFSMTTIVKTVEFMVYFIIGSFIIGLLSFAAYTITIINDSRSNVVYRAGVECTDLGDRIRVDFTGLAAPEAKVDLFANGKQIATSKSDVTGNYTITVVLENEPPREYIFTAQEDNGSRIVGQAGCGFDVSPLPSPTIINDSRSNVVYRAGVGCTNLGDRIRVDFTGLAAPEAKVDLFANGKQIATSKSDVTGNYTITVVLENEPPREYIFTAQEGNGSRIVGQAGCNFDVSPLPSP